VTRSTQRRLRIEISPPVEVEIAERRVRFGGKVMVEYDVDPPLQREWPHGSTLLELHVTDDLEDGAYPTHWEDFPWPTIAPNRVTTRLDRRPPADARRLHVDVYEPGRERRVQRDPQSPALRPIVSFDVELPPDHGLPWREDRDVNQG
jgi:hypothetical protein